MLKCPSCGAELPGPVDECPACGTRTSHLFTPEPEEPRARGFARPGSDQEQVPRFFVERPSKITLISKYEKSEPSPYRNMLYGLAGFAALVFLLVIVCPKGKQRVVHVDALAIRDTTKPALTADQLLAMADAVAPTDRDSSLYLIACADNITRVTYERALELDSNMLAAALRAEKAKKHIRAEALLLFLDRHALLDDTGKRRLVEAKKNADYERARIARHDAGEFRVGETITLESDLRITLTRTAKQDVIIGRRARYRAPHGYFLVTTFRFENGAQPGHFDLSKMYLTAAAGQSYVPQMDHLYALNNANALVTIDPNKTVTYSTAFHVPNEAMGFAVHLGSNAVGKDYRFKL